MFIIKSKMKGWMMKAKIINVKIMSVPDGYLVSSEFLPGQDFYFLTLKGIRESYPSLIEMKFIDSGIPVKIYEAEPVESHDEPWMILTWVVVPERKKDIDDGQ